MTISEFEVRFESEGIFRKEVFDTKEAAIEFFNLFKNSKLKAELSELPIFAADREKYRQILASINFISPELI